MLSKQSFDELWVSRIGVEGARQLRRTSVVGVLVPPTMFGLACVASVLLAGATVGVLLGVALIAVDVFLFASLLRSRRRLADVLTRWFGFEITSARLPRFRIGDFDDWCQSRALGTPGSDLAPVSARETMTREVEGARQSVPPPSTRD